MLDSGETEEIQETAKLMSGRMEFAIVLGGSRSDCHAFSLADPSVPTVHIIHGTLATHTAGEFGESVRSSGS